VNVAYNKGVSTVLILDNAITGMTGHQQNPTTGMTLKQQPTVAIRIEDVCKAAGIQRVRVVDPHDMKAVEAALKEELAVDEPSAIIVRRPCMLLKYVKVQPALYVDPDKCKGCRMCMRIGCPAISIRSGKAVVDATLCIGCGVCTQMCRFGAFQKKEEA
jgi:indolepyruvate ferredoxin oxidoreductase alpha subunit